MAHPIVVLGQQRSGTNVFRELLASGGAEDMGEIFHAEFVDNGYNFYWFLREHLEGDVMLLHPFFHPAMFQHFLEQCVLAKPEANVILDIKVNGMRFLDAGIAEEVPGAVRILREHSARFIHVIRRNKLRLYVSEQIATQTDEWQRTEAVRRRPTRLCLDPQAALRAIDSSLELDRTASFDFATSIFYEDMFNADGSYSGTAREIAAAALAVNVGVLAIRPIRLLRQNPEPLSEIIENFAEVHDCFARTPHAWMLEG